MIPFAPQPCATLSHANPSSRASDVWQLLLAQRQLNVTWFLVIAGCRTPRIPQQDPPAGPAGPGSQCLLKLDRLRVSPVKCRKDPVARIHPHMRVAPGSGRGRRRRPPNGWRPHKPPAVGAAKEPPAERFGGSLRSPCSSTKGPTSFSEVTVEEASKQASKQARKKEKRKGREKRHYRFYFDDPVDPPADQVGSVLVVIASWDPKTQMKSG